MEIYVGPRLVRRLTGGDDNDDDDDDVKKPYYDDDDDCDDDDFLDDLDDLDDIEDEENGGVLTIHGTGEIIRILFRSDYSITRRGFFVKYNVASPLPAPIPCGSPLTIPSGTFTSPGFPRNYPNNADCRFTITVPLGSVLILDFRTFETERCHDYVQIMQGWRAVRRLSGVYGRDDVDDKHDDDGDDDDCDDDDNDDDDECDEDGDSDNDKGDAKRRRRFRSYSNIACVKRIYIRGTGEMITIIFKSDHFFTRRGFEAVYHVVPVPF